MNLLKYVPTKVSVQISRKLLVASKHSPHILFGAGVVGFGATIYFACRATTKLDEVLDNATHKLDRAKSARDLNQADYTLADYRQDKAIIYTRTTASIVKLYSPAVIIGIGSIAALTGSHVVLTKRNLAVTAAYAALDKGFEEYRSRVVDDLGEEKDREYRYGLVDKEIIEETKKGHVTKTIKVPGNKNASIYARFFDESSSMWKREDSYNQLTVRCQQAWANDMLQVKGHMFLNDVYRLLGFEDTREGSVVGWLRDSKTGDGYIDFGVLDNWDNMRFVNGEERSVLLDFNVDGVIWDKI